MKKKGSEFKCISRVTSNGLEVRDLKPFSNMLQNHLKNDEFELQPLSPKHNTWFFVDDSSGEICIVEYVPQANEIEMDELTERNKLLLLQGAKHTGSFTEGWEYSYESWYTVDGDEMKAFCEYLDKEIGGGGSANIDKLYQCFKYPDAKGHKEYALKTKQQMDEINSHYLRAVNGFKSGESGE